MSSFVCVFEGQRETIINLDRITYAQYRVNDNVPFLCICFGSDESEIIGFTGDDANKVWKFLKSVSTVKM